MSSRILKPLRKALAPVQPPERETDAREKRRHAELPKLQAEETGEVVENPRRKTSEFVELEVTSSKGKKYKIVAPKSYAKAIPKVWEWNIQRYRVAELIAEGIPISQITEMEGIGSRMTIYGWLEHPEFREHVDGITLEGGFANKRERIAGMNRLTQKLFQKVMNEIDGTKLTDKSVGAILSAIHQGFKHLAQEKEEFVEASKIEQQTTLNGTLGVAHVNIDRALDSVASEERQKLEEEFNKVADDIIRGLTGEK